MGELLPPVQAGRIRDGLLDYLGTTFSLADQDARAALIEFLQDPVNGIFKGPYARVRLPFQPAADGWRESLGWYEGPTPYGHQAAAFERLSSANLSDSKPRPLPTLVTTGTGSGKTEAFLYPILDHALRAKRAGVTGTKALILYPMNALANDQAQRLAGMITGYEALAGVTAALYTGEKGTDSGVVTADSLITRREVIRSSAPDILLTNYKMLDQLLLRHADAGIWKQSATSLQYLVLDEFHTYDGAQGTDVAMLLRRLGLTLSSHWADDAPEISAEDRERPLGRVTPVATSATLGDKGDPSTMLEFAETVFGEVFPPDAVVTESRLSLDEWISPVAERLSGSAVTCLDDAGSAQAVLAAIDLSTDPTGADIVSNLVPIIFPEGDHGIATADLFRVHPLTRRLAAAASQAVSLADLAPLAVSEGTLDDLEASDYLSVYLAALGHVRADTQDRDQLSVDVHLWVRELTRIDRAAALDARYYWSDDGRFLDGSGVEESAEAPTFPAMHCRNCGRSGWGVQLAPTGQSLDASDKDIRRRALARDERFRAVILAIREAAQDAEDTPDLRWLHVSERRFLDKRPSDEAAVAEGRILPVLMHVGEHAGKNSKDQTCPSCLTKESMRFVGSAIATQLSVTLSTLFGSPSLDRQEKKALIFTDSVQDAAHRAGFVQARSHTLTLRSVLRQAVGVDPISLDALAERVIQLAGDDAHRRHRILPPDLADRAEFQAYWQSTSLAKVPAATRARVRRRLLLDAVLEFGLQSRTGRTLEMVGSATAHVDVSRLTLLSAAQGALEEAGGPAVLNGFEPTESELVAWSRGVLEHMRERGAIDHEWFEKYVQNDGARHWVWGGRPRSQGMPAFPAGRPAPGFPRVGGAKLTKEVDLESVTGSRSWHSLWARRALGVAPEGSGVVARLLLKRLAKLDVLKVTTSDSTAEIFRIPFTSVVVAAVPDDAVGRSNHLLICRTCRTQRPTAPEVTDQLDGAPCTVARCAGRLEATTLTDSFYRRLYGSSDIQRVTAREHTSLLDDKTRLEYENGFKAQQQDPQAPNVLVATPTLELGIDIGDLSTVMLASLPRNVASYLQRVGRAGRLTGNALNLAFVTGRGDQLPRLGEPLSMINGEVRPPATYLDAEEILLRQYFASVVDLLARSVDAVHPTSPKEALGGTSVGSFLHQVISTAESGTNGHLDRFLAKFPGLGKSAAESLRSFVTSAQGEHTSPFSHWVHTECLRWTKDLETLNFRITAMEHALPELEGRAAPDNLAATDDDRVAYRSALGSLRMARQQRADVNKEFWVAALEQHGLLPNYTLVDDSVTLDVKVSWVDAETGDWRDEPYSYHRGASLAIREFAPGATFYAGGHQIEIDAVDVGRDGDAIRDWALCPECGFAQDITDEAVHKECPRCGVIELGDIQQKVHAVRLEKVSAEIRRDEVTIDDSTDERKRERFNIAVSADVDPAKVTHQWFIDGYGFGVRHLRSMTIRWFNLGRSVGQGNKRRYAGRDESVLFFRVCSQCGQLDTNTRTNQPNEHRLWCPIRKAADEDTRKLALMRSLETEGLLVRLPTTVTLGNSFAVPSLSAALLLGLREHLGGSPDHIAIVETVDPVDDSELDNASALLLHDTVPGGTGYLAELADPESLRAILMRAYTTLRDCPCQEEGRLSCHRCLLPFAGNAIDLVSRLEALRQLRTILHGGAEVEEDPDPAAGWTVTTEPVLDANEETPIEQRFRKVVGDRLRKAGATIQEQPTDRGIRWVITLGGARVWTLEPQQNVLNSKPDFLLSVNDPNIPAIAIFCDGWKFHASAEYNRLADDAEKRANLRDDDKIVLGIAWQDLEDSQQPPAWFNPDMVATVTGLAGDELSQATTQMITGTVVDFLVEWVQHPNPDGVSSLAKWLPLMMVGKSTQTGSAEVGAVADRVEDLLRGGVLDVAPGGAPSAWAWVDDTVGVIARKAGNQPSAIEVGLVLDDTKVGEDHAQAWRSWLRLSNLLNLRNRPTTITVSSLVGAAAAATVTSDDGIEVPVELKEALDLAPTEQREFMVEIYSAGLRPRWGDETAGGIPIDISWPTEQIVVDLRFDDRDRADLIEAGWRIVPADLAAIDELLANVGDA